jgi:hypothetical protein
MNDHPKGEYVLASDYDALRAEVERLRVDYREALADFTDADVENRRLSAALERIRDERDSLATANAIWEQTQMHPSLSAGGSANTDPVAGRVIPRGEPAPAADAKADRLAVANNGRLSDLAGGKP